MAVGRHRATGTPGVKASGPQAFQDQIGAPPRCLNAIIFGIALISLLSGPVGDQHL